VTDNDYRSSWIRREYTGSVSFTVQVANGRVSACSVTGGSAPQALKDATCRLIQRRARFNRDGSGAYSNTVRWVIPE
jgi:protein TonB